MSKVGPEVTTLKVGDRVAGCNIGYCGNCEGCRSGHPSHCDNLKEFVRKPGEPPRITYQGQSVAQLDEVGSFAEQILVHESRLTIINDDIPFEKACVLGCAVVTGVGAVINSAKVKPGSTVVVFGCGGVGVNIIQGAKLVGAKKIIAVDVSDHKLEQAKVFGATHIVNGKAGNAVEMILEITDGVGADHAFESAGIEQTLYDSIAVLKKEEPLTSLEVKNPEQNYQLTH